MFPLFATGINNTSGTGGKFAPVIVGTGSKFTASFIDTGGKFATSVVDTIGVPGLSNISANF